MRYGSDASSSRSTASTCLRVGSAGGSGWVRTCGASAGACVESRARVPTARRSDEPRAYLDTCDSTPW